MGRGALVGIALLGGAVGCSVSANEELHPGVNGPSEAENATCGPVEAGPSAEAGGADPATCDPGAGWNAMGPRPCSAALPHVRIEFQSARCAFTLAEARSGISIPYDVVIDEVVPTFQAVPYPYGSNAGGLALQEAVIGGAEGYCNCDQGSPLQNCPSADGGSFPSRQADDAGIELPFPGECPATALEPGVYHREFRWSGRNWFGISDTGAPMGAPFPPGEYVLTVFTLPARIDGALVQASADFVIRLVP